MVLIDMELPIGCETCPFCDFDKYGEKCICKVTGFAAENIETGETFGYHPSSCPMVEYQKEEDDENEKTWFDQFKDCKEPEDMVMLLNGNERLFCPKGYVNKNEDCTMPCGGCICSWLKQKKE